MLMRSHAVSSAKIYSHPLIMPHRYSAIRHAKYSTRSGDGNDFLNADTGIGKFTSLIAASRLTVIANSVSHNSGISGLRGLIA